MRTTLCCGLLWMVGCVEATAPEHGVEAPPQAVDADLEAPPDEVLVSVVFGPDSWVHVAPTLVLERWVATGSCERSWEYSHWLYDSDGTGTEEPHWLSALVPEGAVGGGPFPMPTPGTDPVGFSHLVQYQAALGVGAWVSGGTVTVLGSDRGSPGGLRLEGGEACSAAGCVPMAFPLEFSMDSPWPEVRLRETLNDDPDESSGVDGPGGLPLCP
jgi:hypothetical protein